MQPSTSDDNAALLRPVTDLAVTTLLGSRDSAHVDDKKEISKDFHKRLVTRVRSDTNSRIKALKSGGTPTHHIKLLPADWQIQSKVPCTQPLALWMGFSLRLQMQPSTCRMTMLRS